jgi:hypothetical protein
MTIFHSEMDFLSVNSRFEVQNGEMYLPRITRETCIVILPLGTNFNGFSIVCFSLVFNLQYLYSFFAAVLFEMSIWQ